MHTRRSTLRSVVTLGLSLLAVSSHAPLEAQENYTLRLIRTYGSADVEDDTTRVGSRGKAAGGSMFAAIAGIAQTPDSSVHVLDQEFRKIVTFRPDGTVVRVILGGMGEGPGEFREPADLIVTNRDRLSVLDYDLSRITLFDSRTGQYLRQIRVQVASPLRVFAQGNGFWVMRPVIPTYPIPQAVKCDTTGRVVDQLPPLGPADRPFGGSMLMAFSGSEEIIVPLRQPGLWQVLSNGVSKRIGTPLFPDLKPPEIRDEGGYTTIGGMRAATAGIGIWRQRVLILYRTQRLQDKVPFPIAETVRHHLAIFDFAGRHLGSVELPVGSQVNNKHFYVSPTTEHIFIAATEPFPQVEEFELVER